MEDQSQSKRGESDEGERPRERAAAVESAVYMEERHRGGGANKREPCFVSFGSGFASAFVRQETQRRVEEDEAVVYAVDEREENERRDGPRRNRPTVPCYYLRSLR